MHDTALENMDYYDKHKTYTMMILHYYCGLMSLLHLPGYPIFQGFLDIKCMLTTACTRRSSSLLLQAGFRTLGYEAKHGTCMCLAENAASPYVDTHM